MGLRSLFEVPRSLGAFVTGLQVQIWMVARIGGTSRGRVLMVQWRIQGIQEAGLDCVLELEHEL